MKPILIYVFAFLIVALSLPSCKDIPKTDGVEADIKSWIGREFLFGKLSPNDEKLLKEKDYYLLTYLDSSICNSCRLHAWREYVNETAALSHCNLGSIMVLSPETVLNINNELSSNLSQIDYIVDNENLLLKKNGIPVDDRLRVFLLDKNHRVVCIGNPIINPKVRALFLSYLSKYGSFSDAPKTEAVIANPVIKCNNLVTDSLVYFTFWAKNVGEEEMLIRNISTSCSCISAMAEDNQILPGDSILLTVSYKPTHTGQIIEKVYLNYNGTNSPLAMVIKGFVHTNGDF